MTLNGSFSGNPKTEWLDEAGEDRQMRLLEDFSYRDSSGTEWPAPAGSIVDGASIPAPLWSIVGSPYTGDYRRASVVHDVACGSPGVNRKEADKMFYFACIVGGCSVAQARMLYAGVRIGAWAPHVRLWSESVRYTAVQKGEIRATITDQSVQNTFREIALDLDALPPDATFDELQRTVDTHLEAKSRQ